MESVNKQIESWIKSYASIEGNSNKVQKDLRDSDPVKYFLRLSLPNNFEKYGIILHSYWINHKIANNEIREIENDYEDLPEEDLSRVNWKDFYKLKGLEFDLNRAIISSVNWNYQFKQMNNELLPGEGLIDKEHLEHLSEIVQELYGDQEIEVFYNLLSTTDWKEDKLFQGKISELITLSDNTELNLTPSLIYPKDKNWAVNTDYDLSFTTIGGEAKLIQRLIESNVNEIYEIKY